MPAVADAQLSAHRLLWPRDLSPSIFLRNASAAPNGAAWLLYWLAYPESPFVEDVTSLDGECCLCLRFPSPPMPKNPLEGEVRWPSLIRANSSSDAVVCPSGPGWELLAPAVGAAFVPPLLPKKDWRPREMGERRCSVWG